MKSNLSKRQSDAISHLMQWKVGALFMEAGTGKTRAAMEIIMRSPCSSCVWVGPLRTLGTVSKELAKWGGLGIPVSMYGVESIGQSSRIFMEAESLVDNNTFLVVDESLKIKNAEAIRTKRLLTMGENAEWKLVLNGTPLSRNLLDLWSQMQFLSPRILNMSLARFKDTFCNYTRIRKVLGRRQSIREFITGYENIDYLYSLIRHYVYRCDLHLRVSQFWNEVKYSVGETEKEEYLKIKQTMLSDEKLEFRNNNIFLEMTQKMQHSYCVTPDKFRAVDEILYSEDEGKTVIFCKYIASRKACEKRYGRALVLSYQSESFGLNLQERNVTIFFDKTWDYATRIQSGRRTYRTGQELDCRYYDLTGDVKLEGLIDRNIEKKVSMTEYFKGKTKEEINENL